MRDDERDEDRHARKGARLTTPQGSSRGCRIARHASCAATATSRTPKRRRRTCSGSEVAIWTPTSTPAIDATPTTSGGLEPQVAVARLAPGTDRGRRHDREQRGRGGLHLAEAERDERRHEEDAATDAEQARQDAGRRGRARPRGRPLRCSSGDQPDAEGREQHREGDRQGATRELAAGAPSQRRRRPPPGCRRAARRRRRPCRGRHRATTPAIAVITIAPSEVAVASFGPKPATMIRSGTITIPPPTPKSELNSPATRPMRTSRTRPS